MKWRLKFLWLKARPPAVFLALLAVPFLPVVPWALAAGPGPLPMPAGAAVSEILSLPDPIPEGAADDGTVRGPSPPLNPGAARRSARRWEVKSIDGSGWNLLMTDRFAVRGDIRVDDLRSVGAFAERFLDAVHGVMAGDLADVRLSLRVFASSEDFAAWAECREIEATAWFYDINGAEAALLFGPDTDVSQFCGDLMRGVVHVYLDRATSFNGPSSIARGLADWFADYEVRKGKVVPRLPRGEVSGWLGLAEPGDLEAAWKAWTESSP